jgi:steroid delta-isomerase-like uncharacterized protein
MCFARKTAPQELGMQENVELMKRWYREVWREAKDETIFEIIAPNATLHGQTGSTDAIQGPEGFLAFAQRIREAFPDTEVAVEDVFSVDDKVAVRWVASGTHTGSGLGVAPSGKRISVTGMTIAKIQNGKIVEGWDNWDRLAMLEQIGVYTANPAPALAKTA